MPTKTLPQTSRRVLLGGLIAAPAIALPMLAAAPAAQAQASGAMALVKSVADQLLIIVNGPGSVAEKRPRVRQVLSTSVDVDNIGRFCLGRFWNSASPEQQRAYLELYRSVLENNVSARLGEYVGVKITLLRAQTRDDTEVVSSTVERPNSPPAHVDWIVAKPSGSLKIIDLIAEGTSMRLTQRSDYGAFLGRNGGNVQALIDAMRQQISRNA